MDYLTRLVVIDDHPVLREGLTRFLQVSGGYEVCGFAADAKTGVALVAQHQPDVAIVDLTLPDGNGIGLTKVLRSRHPRLGILVLSAHDEAVFAERLLLAGANGYVAKSAPPCELIDALRTVSTGGTYLSADALARVARRATGHPAGSRYAAGILSARENEVLLLLAEGLVRAGIAARLGISTKTVHAHIENARSKLALKTTAELLRYAMFVMGDPDGTHGCRAAQL